MNYDCQNLNNIHDLSTKTKSWCRPFLDSVKVNKYVLCVDKDYRKNLMPHHGDERVVSSYPTYKYKMFVS